MERNESQMRSHIYYVKFYNHVKYENPDYHQRPLRRMKSDLEAIQDADQERPDSPGSISEIVAPQNVFHYQEEDQCHLFGDDGGV